MDTDAELLQRCAMGDPDAMRELIRRHEPVARRLVTRLVGPGEDLEDVLCDLFVRLWRTAPRYRGDCAPATWIQRAAVSAAVDLLRRRRSARRFERLLHGRVDRAPVPGPEQLLLDREWETERRELARAALALLPPQEQAAVTLYYLEGNSYQEVAALLAVPVTTVRMRLFRARRRMRDQLRKWMADDEHSTRTPLVAALGPQPCAREHAG
jgi:RNA polymerase sigma-70 factor (ECF subfamily)